MNKTIEQIHQDYNGHWVFMINCQKDEYGSISDGEVVIYSENRENVIRKMKAYEFEKSLTYLRYAGKIPEGVNLVL